MSRRWLVTIWLFAGCAGIHTTGLRPADTPMNEAFLVEVTDALPKPPVALVSVSVVGSGRDGTLPTSLSDNQTASMREAAATYGAEMLVVERVDTRWRRAFYGFGVRHTDSRGVAFGDVDCAHAGLSGALTEARRRAQRCLERARAARPALRGTLRVIALVDAFGDVYRAAVTPDSSRDGAMHACGLSAAYGTHFSAHETLLCRISFEVTL